jgi:O-antigen ligase/tetratricopeptide (TPR) repeat protein
LVAFLESADILRRKAMHLLALAMEVIVLLMVCVSPWAYGAVHPGFEFLLFTALGTVLLLWAGRILLASQLTWQKCPVALALAGLFLVGIWQLIPLPSDWLASISPPTALLYEQLLPQQEEVLPLNESRTVVTPPAGSTISLYPAATRRLVLELLAVFLLFAAVRNNIASPSSLRRLAVVMMANGTLLSLFAIVQFFSAKPNTLYWTVTALGHTFGPFVNRNHFACYVNMCLGLGIGFVLSRAARRPETQESSAGSGQTRLSSGLAAPLSTIGDLLQDPPTLAACLALSFMLSAVALSLSRGAMLAFAGGMVLLALAMAITSRRPLRLGIGIFMAAVLLALVSWFGLDLIKDRLATLQKGEAAIPRLQIWERTWPMAMDFPLWGTGYGTYQQMERMYRTSGNEVELSYDHVHNDYLELLVEGGALALLLGLIAIGATYWYGVIAMGRRDHPRTGGLVAGALLGFTTLVLHSIGEFGPHIPAITVLCTVICAQVCFQGSTPRSARRRRNSPEVTQAPATNSVRPTPQTPQYRISVFGLAPLLGATVCVALAATLCAAGWKAHIVDRLQVAALKAADPQGLGASRIDFLKAAAKLAPDDAVLLAELGNVCLKTSDQQKAGLADAGQEKLPPELLIAGLRAYLQARDACPLISEVQLGLAAHASELAKADPPRAYLRRAQLLAPADQSVWYTSGLLELDAQQTAQAWACWRRCLEISNDYFDKIMRQCVAVLTPQDIIELVVPAQPEKLLAAANRLPKGTEAQKQPYLEKALELLDAKPPPLTDQELRIKAQVYKALGKTDDAKKLYLELLGREPGQVDYSLEYAHYLRELRDLEGARSVLLKANAMHPTHRPTSDLLQIVNKERQLPRAKLP